MNGRVFAEGVIVFTHQAIHRTMIAIWQVATKNGSVQYNLHPLEPTSPGISAHINELNVNLAWYFNSCWHKWMNENHDPFLRLTLRAICRSGGYVHSTNTVDDMTIDPQVSFTDSDTHRASFTFSTRLHFKACALSTSPATHGKQSLSIAMIFQKGLTGY